MISTIYTLQQFEQKDCKLGLLQYFPNCNMPRSSSNLFLFVSVAHVCCCMATGSKPWFNIGSGIKAIHWWPSMLTNISDDKWECSVLFALEKLTLNVNAVRCTNSCTAPFWKLELLTYRIMTNTLLRWRNGIARWWSDNFRWWNGNFRWWNARHRLQNAVPAEFNHWVRDTQTCYCIDKLRESDKRKTKENK